ncbi:M28 family peptidase [Lutibacter sp. HS1-25]|uniref:M28 family peptidase n=1 Tax=Lutibacter sp. HS1-25 TaxID=2485000 RepID=UPI001013780C|nr:M28 family peptidase [Lutibacter sp. HS1-25]RXP60340.1 M28 family peptidase [Lutibacter sp. HS1-25]
MHKYSILLLFTLIHFNFSYGQVYNSSYAEIVNKCAYDSIYKNLQQFESYGVKEIGTSSLNNTKNWIINKYNHYGYTNIVEQPFSYFGYNTENIIITKTGSVYPNKYIIIDAHYDTRKGTGTNDNGSGTVILFEIARLLKDINTEYSIKFIHFSGEEDGYIGSQYFINNTVIPQNLDIVLVFNIDEVGGVYGMTNNTIVCERDEINPTANNAASAIVTNELANCVGLYSNLTAEISFAYLSDYIPFEANGEIITGFFEKNKSTHPHTISDVFTNLDVNYVYEVSKAAIGASLHFSKALKNVLNIDKNYSFNNIIAYPNPTNNEVSILLGETKTDVKIYLRNTIGQTILTKSYEAVDHIKINIENQQPGLYFLILETKLGKSKNIKIIKK